MQATSYDFVVLGDTQPEGLLLAAGLARLSYRVGLFPSEVMGEWPSQAAWPIRLPDRFRQHRMDEFLFRAGFFRLEDSGLEPSAFRQQVLLARHRVCLDGSQNTWVEEVRREFPQHSEKLLKLQSQGKKKSELQVSRSALSSLMKQDPAFEQLSLLECFDGRHLNIPPEARAARLSRAWMHKARRSEAKVFRVKPELDQPYHKFLLEHCRKWGVHVFEEAPQVKRNWRKFEVLPGKKAKTLVVNTLAGAKLLHQMKSSFLPHRISHWLYFDRLTCRFDQIPEPLEEHAFIHQSLCGDSSSDSEVSVLHVRRDRLRDEAVLTLGTWLAFEESRRWENNIQDSRRRLKKLMPFLSEDLFPRLPSILELSEMKGECVRRSELERLLFWRSPESFSQSLWKRLRFLVQPKSRLFREGSQLICALPYWGPYLSREESFAQCVQVLDYFDRKRKPNRQQAASLN